MGSIQRWCITTKVKCFTAAAFHLFICCTSQSAKFKVKYKNVHSAGAPRAKVVNQLVSWCFGFWFWIIITLARFKEIEHLDNLLQRETLVMLLYILWILLCTMKVGELCKAWVHGRRWGLDCCIGCRGVANYCRSGGGLASRIASSCREQVLRPPTQVWERNHEVSNYCMWHKCKVDPASKLWFLYV